MEQTFKPKQFVMSAEIFEDILKTKEELDLVIESLEIMNNPEVMVSLKKSMEEINQGKTRSFNKFLKEKREQDGLEV